MDEQPEAWRDVVWGGAAVVFVVLTVRYTRDIVLLVLDAPSAVDAAPIVIVGVVVVAAGVWLTRGAWQRTRWG